MGAGFDVDQDVEDGGNGVTHDILHLMGDAMGMFDGHEGMDVDMHVDQESVAHAPYEDFLDAIDGGDGGGGLMDLGEDLRGRLGVHEVFEGGAEDAPSVPCDDSGGDEGGDVLGTGPGFAADQGDGDPDGGGEGSDGIGTMMPGIGFDGAASGEAGLGLDPAEEAFLDCDDDNEDGEGEGFGAAVRVEEFAEGMHADAGGGDEEEGADAGGGEGFGLAMAIGMFGIGRFGGDAHATPDDHGGEEIGEGLDGIGDEGLGMAEDAGHEFGGAEDGIDGEPDEGCPEIELE